MGFGFASLFVKVIYHNITLPSYALFKVVNIVKRKGLPSLKKCAKLASLKDIFPAGSIRSAKENIKC
jgi:hypothetical protein